MKVYTLKCELLAECPLEKVFSAFKDPYNLAKITPPWLNFQVTSKDRVEMRKGAEIDYVIRWLGLPIKWKTLIREYDPPSGFVDEQAKGPYRLWHHRHTFKDTGRGVLIGDHVDYALPLGVLGVMAHAAMVRNQLLEIFRYRQREIGKLLESPTTQTVQPSITSKKF